MSISGYAAAQILTCFHKEQMLVIIVHVAGRCYFMDRNAMKHLLRERKREEEKLRYHSFPVSPSLHWVIFPTRLPAGHMATPHLTCIILHNLHIVGRQGEGDIVLRSQFPW